MRSHSVPGRLAVTHDSGFGSQTGGTELLTVTFGSPCVLRKSTNTSKRTKAGQVAAASDNTNSKIPRKLSSGAPHVTGTWNCG